MSSKRKWDEAGPDGSSTPETAPKVAKSEESRDASTAAAAAAAIAAKIAAQFSAGGAGGIGGKDPHDGDYVKDIDINDVRNRYLLTKGSTQQQVCKSVISYSRTYSNLSCRFTMRRVHLLEPRGLGIPTARRRQSATLPFTCTFLRQHKKCLTRQSRRSTSSSIWTWVPLWKTKALVDAKGYA